MTGDRQTGTKTSKNNIYKVNSATILYQIIYLSLYFVAYIWENQIVLCISADTSISINLHSLRMNGQLNL